MPSLLDLPNELLYAIVVLVAQSPYCVSTSSRHRPAQLHSRPVICYPESRIRYPCATNLLLTNRRLQSAVQLYLTRNPPSFELDVAIVDGNWIWPTFKCIPPKQSRGAFERLLVNIIPCCNDDERGHEFAGTPGNADAMLEMCKTVSTLLLQGPHHMASHRSSTSREMGLHFQSIIFNVNAARQVNGSPCFSHTEIPFRTVEGLKHLDFEPLHPVGVESCRLQLAFLITILKSGLRRFNAGLVLCERANEIVFMADGCTLDGINITKDAKENQQRHLSEYWRRIGGDAGLT